MKLIEFLIVAVKICNFVKCIKHCNNVRISTLRRRYFSKITVHLLILALATRPWLDVLAACFQDDRAKTLHESEAT